MKSRGTDATSGGTRGGNSSTGCVQLARVYCKFSPGEGVRLRGCGVKAELLVANLLGQESRDLAYAGARVYCKFSAGERSERT